MYMCVTYRWQYPVKEKTALLDTAMSQLRARVSIDLEQVYRRSGVLAGLARAVTADSGRRRETFTSSDRPPR